MIRCKEFTKTNVSILSFPQMYILTNAHMICLVYWDSTMLQNNHTY